MKSIDTGTHTVLGTVEDGLAVLTLNRPERLNALSGELTDGLARALDLISSDPDVGCVMLTGSGRAFCAGGDVKGMDAAASSPRAVSLERRVQSLRVRQRASVQRLWELPMPTIAAINGAAAGGGLALALACDLRYVADGAVLTTAYAGVALSGDYGATWFLTRYVGTARARELLYFGDRIEVHEAERLGLVNAVLPSESFAEDVRARAARLARGPRSAHRSMKENLNRALGGGLAECLDGEALLLQLGLTTSDHHEAARAFVEKRPPVFGGSKSD